MKFLPKILILFLFPLFVVSQERVTDLTSDGTSCKYQLYEFNGENYIFAITKFDSIKVYKMQGTSPEYLHGNYYPNIYLRPFLQIDSNYIFLTNIGDASVYNFIDNSFFEIPNEPSFHEASWSGAKSGSIILEREDITNRIIKNYLVDYLNEDFIELSIDESILGVSGDDIIYSRAFNGTTTYYHLDVPSNRSEKIDGDVESFYMSDSHFYYLTPSGLFSYNFETKNTSPIYSLSSSFSFLNLKVNDSNFLVSYRVGSSSFVVMIDRETFVSEVFEMPDYINSLSSTIVSNHLVFLSSGKIYFYNVLTQEHKFFNRRNTSFGGRNIIGDMVIFRTVNGFEIVDLSTDEYNSFELDLPNGTYSLTSAFENNSNFYLNLDSSDDEFYGLYEVDFTNKFYRKLNHFPSHEIGLNSESELFLFDDQPMFYSDGLFKIENADVISLNTNPIIKINNEYFKSNDEILSWAQKDENGIGIYKYENGETTLNTLIPYLIIPNQVDTFDLEEYAIVGSKTYFVGEKWNARLRCFDAISNKFYELEDLDLGFVNYQFYVIDDNVYFFDDSLWVITPELVVKAIKSDYEEELDGVLIEFEDGLYLSSDEYIYSIREQQLDTFLNISESSLTLVGESPKYIVLKMNGSNDSKYFIFNGDTIVSYNLEENQKLSFINDHFFRVTDDGYIQSIIDMRIGRAYDFPESIEAGLSGYIMERESDNLLLTRKVDYWNRDWTVYKTDKNFENYEVVFEFSDPNFQINYNYAPLLQRDLFYFRDKIFSITNDLEFVKFEGIAGDNLFAEFLRSGDHYYFIAIDPEYGRQVFRLPLDFDDILDITRMPISRQYLKTYPNPTGDILAVDTAFHVSLFKFFIYNMSGSLIDSGQSQRNEIDTSMLNSGTYFLLIQDMNGEVYSSKFVKI